MKGQLTIEYLISFIIFIGLIAYIYLSYSANIPSFIEEVKKEDTRSKAFQLSEVLINDPGEPETWDETTVERVGLLDQSSNRQNLISQVKINELRDLTGSPCNDIGYDKLKSKLSMDKEFSVIISEIDTSNGNRNPLYNCFPPSPIIGAINTTLIRVIAVNDSGTLTSAEIVIQM